MWKRPKKKTILKIGIFNLKICSLQKYFPIGFFRFQLLGGYIWRVSICIYYIYILYILYFGYNLLYSLDVIELDLIKRRERKRYLFIE